MIIPSATSDSFNIMTRWWKLSVVIWASTFEIQRSPGKYNSEVHGASVAAICVGDWGNERRRREDRGAEGAEGRVCGEWCSPPD